jgi:hypothetical protein
VTQKFLKQAEPILGSSTHAWLPEALGGSVSVEIATHADRDALVVHGRKREQVYAQAGQVWQRSAIVIARSWERLTQSSAFPTYVHLSSSPCLRRGRDAGPRA